jgi:formylglycine-generating enzyme required for sulfatase activity
MGAKQRKQRKVAVKAATRWRGPVLWTAAAVIAAGAGWSFSARRAAAPEPAEPPLPAPAAAAAPEPGFEPTRPGRGAPDPAPAGMAWIPGGEFSMGSSDPTCLSCGGKDTMPDARPIHRVQVDGFWMDRTEVTNAQWRKFVAATGYVTVAERKPRAEDFPGAPPEKLVPGGVVFSPPVVPVTLDNHFQWWSYVKGANWRQPGGSGSGLKGRENCPVVQIAYEDAAAYAKWAGKQLPTEAEWEFAARGGLSGKPYAWGEEFRPGGRWLANIFQGRFPTRDTGEDGFKGIAPVAQFPPNRYGLYDMAGNVWEWCRDWYRADYYADLAGRGGVARNPQGPESSEDPAEPGVPKRVHRGGSYLCTDQYCTRYMIGTRGKGEVSTGTNHLGFRCVKAVP